MPANASDIRPEDFEFERRFLAEKDDANWADDESNWVDAPSAAPDARGSISVRAPAARAPDPELGERPPLTAPASERAISGAITEPITDMGAALLAAFKYVATNPHEVMTPGVPAYRLAQTIHGGLSRGSEEQFTKMFEQYDRGGINERGENESLSPVGRGIAGMVPGVGPLAADVVDRGASGDVAGATGQAISTVAMGEILRKLFQAPPRIQRGVEAKDTARVDTARRTAREATSEADALAESRRGLVSATEEAKNRGYVEEFEKLRKIRQANLPTDVESTNAALGVTKRHLGTNPESRYRPAEGVLENKIPLEEGGRPRSTPDVRRSIESKLDDLGNEKASEIASTPGVVAPASKLDDLASRLDDDIADLKDLEDAAGVSQVQAVQNRIRDWAKTGDHDASQVNTLLGRVDAYIKKSKGPTNEARRNALFGIRREIRGWLVDANPRVGEVNRHRRNLSVAAKAARDKELAEAASHGPRQVPEPALPRLPEGPLVPGHGPIREGMIGFPPEPVAPPTDIAGALRAMGNLPLYGPMATPARASARVLAFLISKLQSQP